MEFERSEKKNDMGCSDTFIHTVLCFVDESSYGAIQLVKLCCLPSICFFVVFYAKKSNFRALRCFLLWDLGHRDFFSVFFTYLQTTSKIKDQNYIGETHCSKSSFFVQKFNFEFPRKLSIFLGEKLVKMLWFWTF